MISRKGHGKKLPDTDEHFKKGEKPYLLWIIGKIRLCGVDNRGISRGKGLRSGVDGQGIRSRNRFAE